MRATPWFQQKQILFGSANRAPLMALLISLLWRLFAQRWVQLKSNRIIVFNQKHILIVVIEGKDVGIMQSM